MAWSVQWLAQRAEWMPWSVQWLAQRAEWMALNAERMDNKPEQAHPKRNTGRNEPLSPRL